MHKINIFFSCSESTNWYHEEESKNHGCTCEDLPLLTSNICAHRNDRIYSIFYSDDGSDGKQRVRALTFTVKFILNTIVKKLKFIIHSFIFVKAFIL